MVTVMSLVTQQKQTYSCIPIDAVIAAYAQSKKDWNTWDYRKNYAHLVEYGKETLLVGDFLVFKDGRPIA